MQPVSPPPSSDSGGGSAGDGGRNLEIENSRDSEPPLEVHQDQDQQPQADDHKETADSDIEIVRHDYVLPDKTRTNADDIKKQLDDDGEGFLWKDMKTSGGQPFSVVVKKEIEEEIVFLGDVEKMDENGGSQGFVCCFTDDRGSFLLTGSSNII